MSIGDVKAVIGEGNHSLDQATTTVEGIGTALKDVIRLVLATLDGSEHEKAEEARGALVAAQREVDLTLRTIKRAKDNASTFVAGLG
ncbi:hypothetical protein GCM10011608_37860 [Micromonospora sonchi]|uniref:Uncharacterized protein n=1 Tax=Micromonospora sonchi TaxID=1763543 RepID=A0A917U0I7_9ACTN|nr:hypothetical protein [Micromonospora sonchi]GGM49313.1 hypothetical protein GCM10011608_37860 [Micromonospora sonchi]